jgi:hypothetical protein
LLTQKKKFQKEKGGSKYAGQRAFRATPAFRPATAPAEIKGPTST